MKKAAQKTAERFIADFYQTAMNRGKEISGIF
jgi:hypothetical protein